MSRKRHQFKIPAGSSGQTVAIPSASPLTTEIATRAAAGDFTLSGLILPNPDPVLRKAGIAISTYQDLLVNPRIGSAYEQRLAGTTSRPWRINPPADSGENETALVTAIFANLPLKTILEGMLGAVGFGYAVAEITSWDYSATLKALVPKVISKPQQWFGFDSNNSLRFKSRTAPWEGEDLSQYPQKFLLTRNRADYHNPYGIPLLSRCFWYDVFKKGGLQFWAAAMEKFGMPWVVARHALGTSEPDKQKIMASLAAMVQDAIALVPLGTEIDFKEVANGNWKGEIYEKLLRYADEETSVALLGHTGTSQATPGKLGSEDAALQVRDDLISSDITMVTETINTLIRWIIDLNIGSGIYPTFEIYTEKGINTALADVATKAFSTGVHFTEQFWTDNYSWKPEWFTVGANLAPAPAPAPTFSADLRHENMTLPGTGLARQTSSIDTLKNRLSTEANPASTALITPFITLMNEAQSLEELRDRIFDLYPKMDASELGNIMTTAFAAADLLGRFEAKNEK